MGKIEKIVLAVIVFLVIAVGFMINLLFTTLEKAGGAKKVVIEAGKEVKDIVREIKADDNVESVIKKFSK